MHAPQLQKVRHVGSPGRGLRSQCIPPLAAPVDLSWVGVQAIHSRTIILKYAIATRYTIYPEIAFIFTASPDVTRVLGRWYLLFPGDHVLWPLLCSTVIFMLHVTMLPPPLLLSKTICLCAYAFISGLVLADRSCFGWSVSANDVLPWQRPMGYGLLLRYLSYSTM